MIVASHDFYVDVMNSNRQEKGKLGCVVQIMCRMAGGVPFPQHVCVEVIILLLVEILTYNEHQFGLWKLRLRVLQSNSVKSLNSTWRWWEGGGGGWAGVVDGFGSDLYHRLSLNGHL